MAKYANFRLVAQDKAKPNKYQAVAYRYMEMVTDKFGPVGFKQTGGAPHGWAGFSKVPNVGCAPTIAAPNPTNPEKLYVLIHEVGHLMLGHHKNGFFKGCGEHLVDIESTLEYEAESFALDAMAKERISLPQSVVFNAYMYVGMFIVNDEKAGHRINPKALKFARHAVNSKGEAYVDLALAGKVKLSESKGCCK